MCSSRQKSRNSEKGSPLPCPECGKTAMTKIVGPSRLLDGTVVADLPHYHCSSCGEDFFDRAAMKQIQNRRMTPRRRVRTAV